MFHLPKALGPAIDPDTACVACGSQEQAKSMLICDSCQQGVHLQCFGLAVIPEEDQWVCAGCTGLQSLEIGSTMLLESPQVLYADGSDPHMMQGLFNGSIRSVGKLQQDSSGTLCQVQAEMDSAAVTESLKFYSNNTLKQLVRPPKPSLQLTNQLYELSGIELSSIILNSRRHTMFGSPAAAAGLATEAWCLLLDDAAATAQQVLAQPAKQVYLIERSKTHKAALPSATVELALPLHTSAEQQQARTIHSYPASQSEGLNSMQYKHPAPVMPYFYTPVMLNSVPTAQSPAGYQHHGMLPYGWSYGPLPAQHVFMPHGVPAAQPQACFQQQGMLPFGWQYGPKPVQHCLVPNSVLAAAAQHPASKQHQSTAVTATDRSKSAAVTPRQDQQAKAKRVKQQLCVQEACRVDNDSDAVDTSDDDWLAQRQVAPANAQDTKVDYKVLPTPRAKGSRMMVNPSLTTQKARTVCAVGLKLWRHVISSAEATTANSRIQLTPAQIKQTVASFFDEDASHKSFLEMKDNRNLIKHIATLLQLLSVTDDQPTIQTDIVTTRVMSCVNLHGIDSTPSTVKVYADTLRIDLHSPLPNAAITDFGEAMQARGTLKREPQGCIRTLETTQLHILYAWHGILSQLSGLSKWSKPELIPDRMLDQINRLCCELLGWYSRGAAR